MSFASVFHQVPWKERYEQCLSTTPEQVEEALEGSSHPLARFERLISPAAGDYLEALCQLSQSITQQRFGKVIRLLLRFIFPMNASIIAPIVAFQETTPSFGSP